MKQRIHKHDITSLNQNPIKQQQLFFQTKKGFYLRFSSI